MEEKSKIVFLGGDRRSSYLFDAIARRYGDRVEAYGLPRGKPAESDWQAMAAQAKYLLLPVPAVREGALPMEVPNARRITLEEVLACARPDSRIIGGFLRAPQDARVENLLANEAFLLDNAQTTAEGAICIALQHMQQGLRDARCLVTGYGRVAKALVRLLLAFDAQVWVAARREEALEEARDAGALTVPLWQMEEPLGQMDVVFNTVPQRVLGEYQLSRMRRDVVILDLASAPYGVDLDAAREMKMDAAAYPSLPGKMFPRSAAQWIRSEERRVG
ncbi:MAG: dipicolinate synthase subunit DpsA, partial [Eubacteriales bacterium]|nr:dipicolinate synthase subunit DpsA [Eubacteriales bacterium]